MKLGLIGLKGHQSVVLEGARQLGGVELVAVSDDVKADLEKFKKREALAKDAEVYTDWKHLLDHAMMDVCCVCDENHLRAEQLIALARRNIHIVTEKPLATTLEDLERIKSALARSKSQLTMLLTMRHEAKYATLRRLLRQGAIGAVCQASAQKSYQLHTRPDWFKDRRRLGGTIPYIGIHAVDLMAWTTGLDYTHVAAFHGRLGKEEEMKETESQASLLLRMSNGASATARLDYLRPQPASSHGDDRLRIAGTEGVLEVRYPEDVVHLVTSKQKAAVIAPDRVPNLFVAFAEALRKGESPPIPADDCVYITEVVLKAREAADKQVLMEIGARKKG
jgi:predicted dehydrogenase